MNVKKKLFDEFQALCKTMSMKSEKVGRELSEFISGDEVIEWLIVQGPLPSFPETQLEVWVVSDTVLYDFEVRKLGSLQHILPMSKMVGIEESFEERGTEEYLSVRFVTEAFGTGLILQGKLKDSKNIRRFSKAVKQRIS